MTDPIPARRLAPEHHLKRAAQSDLGSEAETYHLQAATAEALTRILFQLNLLTSSSPTDPRP